VEWCNLGPDASGELKKKSVGIFPVEMGVIPSPTCVHSYSLPFPFIIFIGNSIPVVISTHDRALYKSTVTFLTYLLTYLLRSGCTKQQTQLIQLGVVVVVTAGHATRSDVGLSKPETTAIVVIARWPQVSHT